MELLDFPHLVETTLSKEKKTSLGNISWYLSYIFPQWIWPKPINQLINVELPKITQKKQTHPQLDKLTFFKGTSITNLSICNIVNYAKQIQCQMNTKQKIMQILS